MQKLKVSLILCLLLGNSHALIGQQSWTYIPPTHRFVVDLEKSYNFDSTESLLFPSRVRIYRGTEIAMLQFLSLDEGYGEYRPDSKDQYFVVEDMNFDGHPDVRLFLGCTASGCFQHFWGLIFDPATGYFSLCEEMKGISDPVFNQEHQYVHSFLRTGFEYFGHRVYKWIGGKLTQVLEQYIDFDGSVKTLKWVNGEWVPIQWPSLDLQGDAYRHKECDLYKAWEQ